jgi:hypothetical protein
MMSTATFTNLIALEVVAVAVGSDAVLLLVVSQKRRSCTKAFLKRLQHYVE